MQGKAGPGSEGRQVEPTQLDREHESTQGGSVFGALRLDSLGSDLGCHLKVVCNFEQITSPLRTNLLFC